MCPHYRVAHNYRDNSCASSSYTLNPVHGNFNEITMK
jgi:hypothetical protein